MTNIIKILVSSIILLILCYSCSSNTTVKLLDDENVREVFNEEEILFLSQIVGFFDSVIVEGAEDQDINESYHLFFNGVRESESFEDLRTHVGIANSSEARELVEGLKGSGIFNEIWKYQYSYDYITKDTITIHLTPNMQGKYFQLMELLGARNDFFREYVNTVRSVGAIPPSLIAGIQRAHNNFDFHKEINRLVWAVHYITILSEKEYE